MFDYITSGPPTIPSPPRAALLLDQTNATLYVTTPESPNGWVAIAATIGGVSDSVQSVSTTGSVGFAGGVNSFIKATSGAGGITLTLLSAVGVSGRSLTIKKIDSGVGAVTIATSSSQNIDGSTASYVLPSQWQYIKLESDGSNWFIVANN